MVNLDSAQLLFQMIIAQHADKTWGEVCKLLGFNGFIKDKKLKINESKCEIINESFVTIDHKNAIEYLICYDCVDLYYLSNDCEIENVSFEKVVSIVSFEDKI